MPASALAFRAVCGCFVSVFVAFMLKRASLKAAMRQRVLTPRNRLHGVMVGLLLFLLFFGNLLHQCGDVELNPGPPKQDSFRQTRLTSGNRENTTTGTTTAGERTANDPTLKDVMQVLTTLDSKFDRMKNDMSDIKELYSSLKEEVQGMRGTISDLEDENRVLKDNYSKLQNRLESIERKTDDLKTENESLEERIVEMGKKTDDLESRSKRNNLIIHGLVRLEKETGEDCESMLKDMITDKLELVDDFQFDRVHRLNSKPNSPVIARCTFFKDKVKILKAKRKLRGSDVFIGEDFSSGVRDLRRKLVPHLKKARSENKKATMVFDHLIIEGQKFTVDDQDRLKEMR